MLKTLTFIPAGGIRSTARHSAETTTMTMIPTIQLAPIVPTLAFFAEEYDATGDDITTHQAAAALVAAWKAGNLDMPCPSCQAHVATTPAEQITAARDLLIQAIAQPADTADG